MSTIGSRTLSSATEGGRRGIGLAAGLAVLGALALALTATPVQGVQPEDHWSGTWTFTADGGNTYGKIKLELHHNHETLTGVYEGGTSGTIGGSLNREYGRVWCGKYRDTHGQNTNRGKFCVTLESDHVSFSGWYNTCYYLPSSLCHTYRWSGERA